MRHEFIGAGWAFPLHTDATGSMALVAGDREVAEAIRLILATMPGERPMRPAFGCNIHDLVFAPADAATAGQIAYEVRVSLDRWEPRILLDDVVVSFDRVDEGMLLIDIRYRLRDSNDPRNLVFPFYTIPAHDGPDGIAAEQRPAEIAAATDAVALSKGDA
ncbi:GPW/gp25 family protein [Fodinicola feengrottensis]|uniref:GPW/gp25 family protein n=1 Tax=Fodinicola feengrottensis TaxID=435914 RepID=A0ABN2FW22_9ACTN|nr:GPW/gp25 family protein [Fodinicola feengrottensis]